MNDDAMKPSVSPAADIFVRDGAGGNEIPIWLVGKDAALDALPLSPAQRAWVEAVGFKGAAKQQALVPGVDGGIAAVLFGLGDGAT